MKKCPYCAEDIQDAAVKCRYCRETLFQEHGGSAAVDAPALTDTVAKAPNAPHDVVREYDHTPLAATNDTSGPSPALASMALSISLLLLFVWILRIEVMSASSLDPRFALVVLPSGFLALFGALHFFVVAVLQHTEGQSHATAERLRARKANAIDFVWGVVVAFLVALTPGMRADFQRNFVGWVTVLVVLVLLGAGAGALCRRLALRTRPAIPLGVGLVGLAIVLVMLVMSPAKIFWE